MDITKSRKSDLRFCHEDYVDMMLDKYRCNGQVPLYIIRSVDDEAFFVSTTPITVERITKEFPKAFLCINKTAPID